MHFPDEPEPVTAEEFVAQTLDQRRVGAIGALESVTEILALVHVWEHNIKDQLEAVRSYVEAEPNKNVRRVLEFALRTGEIYIESVHIDCEGIARHLARGLMMQQEIVDEETGKFN